MRNNSNFMSFGAKDNNNLVVEQTWSGNEGIKVVDQFVGWL